MYRDEHVDSKGLTMAGRPLENWVVLYSETTSGETRQLRKVAFSRARTFIFERFDVKVGRLEPSRLSA